MSYPFVYPLADPTSGTTTASSVCTKGFSLVTSSTHSACIVIFCPKHNDLINLTCLFSCNVLLNALTKNFSSTATDQSSGIRSKTYSQPKQTKRGGKSGFITIVTSKKRPHRSRRFTVCVTRSSGSSRRKYSPNNLGNNSR